MKIFPRNKTDIIISYILQNPNTKVKVNEIANELSVNKGSVSLTTKELDKVGILNHKQVNLENPIAKALKILITIEKFAEGDAITILKDKAITAGIYGSSAKGTDTEESDIDIWIKPRKKFGKLDSVKLSIALTKLIGKRIQIISLNEEKLESIRKNNKNFYYSLLFGSIIIFGEGIE